MSLIPSSTKHPLPHYGAEAIALVPSDVLHRYRSHANLRRGHYDDALEDAGKAVVLNALSPQNLLCQAHMLQRNEMLQEVRGRICTSPCAHWTLLGMLLGDTKENGENGGLTEV